MGRCYDYWERLVEAVLRREQLRIRSLADSRSPSIRSTDSDISLSSSSRRKNLSSTTTPSPLHADLLKLKLAQTEKEAKLPAKIRDSMRKGLSIFSGFSSKKNYGRAEREAAWFEAQRKIDDLETLKTALINAAEKEKMRAMIARLREVNTLTGHIESLMKSKGLDIDSINMNYTI